jgi:uncharacterized membrane protein YsdA (DUF1294 family)
MSSVLFQKIGLTWYAIFSLALFALYGLDKAQAIAEGRRIPERALHLLALAGGFFGGLLGRSVFHHKTRKPNFLIILLVSAAAHILLWIGFYLTFI